MGVDVENERYKTLSMRFLRWNITEVWFRSVPRLVDPASKLNLTRVLPMVVASA